VHDLAVQVGWSWHDNGLGGLGWCWGTAPGAAPSTFAIYVRAQAKCRANTPALGGLVLFRSFFVVGAPSCDPPIDAKSPPGHG
jgi:hypothetical protein